MENNDQPSIHGLKEKYNQSTADLFNGYLSSLSVGFRSLDPLKQNNILCYFDRLFTDESGHPIQKLYDMFERFYAIEVQMSSVNHEQELRMRGDSTPEFDGPQARYIRCQSGLTQKELSKLVGIKSQTTLSAWEHSRQKPTRDRGARYFAWLKNNGYRGYLPNLTNEPGGI